MSPHPSALPAATPGVAGSADRVEQRAPHVLRAALALALLALGGLLVLGPKPWELPGGPGFFQPPEGRAFGDDVRIGLWWAAAVNAALCALLLATARGWTRPLRLAPAARRRVAAPPSRRRWLAWVLLAMALALALRVPLAQKSLWWDEGWTVRQVVVGWHAPPDAPLEESEWRDGGLARSLWYWKKPTNHVLYSVSAWLSLSAWRAVSGADERSFHELAYRAPALAASALSVLVIGLLLRAWGLAGAGLAAAFLMALHPWHLRYGVDGRAYGFVVLFTLTGALGLTRWLRSRGWLDLGLYAASQLALIWSYPYAAFVTVGFALSGSIAVAFDRQPGAVRRTLAVRFAVAHLLAAMVLLQLLAPNLTHTSLWDYAGGVASHALLELWTGLAVGMIAVGSEAAAEAGIPSLQRLDEERPWMGPLVFVLIPLVVAVGYVRACLQGGAAAAILAGITVAAALALAATQALDQHFYPRFLSFLLPLVVVCAAAALDLGARVLWPRRGRWKAGVALALVLLAYQAVVWPQTRLLLRHPYEPLRDVAHLLADVAPADASLRVGVGLGGAMPRIYDPHIRYAETATELSALCREAKQEDRELLAFYGHPSQNARRYDAVALLEDPAWFEPVGERWGIEPRFHYRVFRLHGGCPDARHADPPCRDPACLG